MALYRSSELKLSRSVLYYECIENNDKLLNAFEGAFEKTIDVFETLEIEDTKRQDLAVLMARYTLGLQIKYCLEKNGDCSVYCEC